MYNSKKQKENAELLPQLCCLPCQIDTHPFHCRSTGHYRGSFSHTKYHCRSHFYTCTFCSPSHHKCPRWNSPHPLHILIQVVPPPLLPSFPVPAPSIRSCFGARTRDDRLWCWDTWNHVDTPHFDHVIRQKGRGRGWTVHISSRSRAKYNRTWSNLKLKLYWFDISMNYFENLRKIENFILKQLLIKTTHCNLLFVVKTKSELSRRKGVAYFLERSKEVIFSMGWTFKKIGIRGRIQEGRKSIRKEINIR